MRVFITGATGGIGSAVVAELLSTGHEVLGLARSDASAARLEAAGGSVLRGDISDPDVLRAGAQQADGVMHLAFGHDFTDFAGAIAQEGAATRTLGKALLGTGKPLVMASGTPAVPGQVTTEETVANEGTAGGRGVNAQHVIDLVEQGVRSAVVRLPRSVHQAGVAFGFAGMLINAARRTGVSGFVGDGSQRWPAVHRLDAAHLFCVALDHAEPGTVLHAVGDEGDTMRSLADEIGRQLGLPVEQVPAESFGFLGTIFGVDQPSSSALTRERFGWEPTHPSLLADLATGDYPA
ncbi:MAG: 3-beta hydroxysteroid dehydrogenase [Microbacterium sp. 14-71-5]|nr:MAG: 3-beta hydroxysteroid dehydrogenase [Microbacterium sp. 14-71-5]